MRRLIWFVSRITVVLGALLAAAWWLLLWPAGVLIALVVAAAGIGTVIFSRALVLVPLVSLAGTEFVMMVIAAQPIPQPASSPTPYTFAGIGFLILHWFARDSIGPNAAALLVLAVASAGLFVESSVRHDHSGHAHRFAGRIVGPVRRWIVAGSIIEND